MKFAFKQWILWISI